MQLPRTDCVSSSYRDPPEPCVAFRGVPYGPSARDHHSGWCLCQINQVKGDFYYVQPKEDGILAAWVRGWTTSIAEQPLYSDDLGEEPPVDTYLGAFRTNVERIAAGLGGDGR